MWQFIKNLVSYVHFVFSLDWFLLVSTIIDFLILLWAIYYRNEQCFGSSMILVVIAVFINFVWQIVNVAGHFAFLRKANPGKTLMSMLKKSEGDKKDFSLIMIDRELLQKNDFPYIVNVELGVLENPKVVELLRSETRIITELNQTKRGETRMYIMQYKQTLLKFLNQKWYEICHKGGLFTNDKKVCLASELFPAKEKGSFKWRVTKGYYYQGYLTNFIYTQYVGGTRYKVFPPANMKTDPIKSLGDSDFSDHIGVSTLLYTSDGSIFIFRQALSAGYNAYYYVPTGSGSVDYSDFKEGEDMREMIIWAAERELAEESSLKKKLGKEAFKQLVHTQVIGYYRDMERGGKPEFCCVSRIDKTETDVKGYIEINDDEIAGGSRKSMSFSNNDVWENIYLPEASLSLKMNYKFLKEYLNQA